MTSPPSSEDVPYWQVNIPVDQRTATCPDFLLNINAKDRGIISTRQEDSALMSWPEVRAVIAANQLQKFQRTPLALRRYLEYCWGLKEKYGSAVHFVLRERLHWTTEELAARVSAEAATGHGSIPDFSDSSDVKILCNDWPYGLDERIVHLVVWTKFPLPEDPTTGDLTDDARAAIEAYVQQTFRAALPADSVIWFKNWRSLKSVLLVEHFHVMLFDPPVEFVARITNGDVPLSKRLEGDGQ
ncbi:uncharacterized protein SPSK_06593 [Sporothrix schenckii 1099-18]|uniref:N-acetylglucosamine-induced protein 1 n=2 Tax=Sporothrix schenckii TaxID=29908 RepID=U7PK79_SPOS1|nr:uncharacterized protein SPSK_06593 [Sporothrix schenckii 1099-18]ERS95139.1 hypothetical protein HMPREF1624_08349 [Sporothrix schenckii ATCC 58251]KJR89927.1 hypothetical protein SPSK_06593 [Sporothrix schenckii 1099-18]